MSERIDIMKPPIDCLPYFAVDNTVLYKPVAYPASLPVNYLIAGDGRCAFEQGDNFIIMTSGLIMPLSFQLDRSSTTWPYLRFSMYAYGETTGKQYPLKEISGTGASPFFFLPMENYDTPMDIFVDIQNQSAVTGSYLKNEKFTIGLSLTLYLTDISMVGVPAALNASIQFIIPYVKILHNFELSAPTP